MNRWAGTGHEGLKSLATAGSSHLHDHQKSQEITTFGASIGIQVPYVMLQAKHLKGTLGRCRAVTTKKRSWRNWQTHYLEVVAPKGIPVQVRTTAYSEGRSCRRKGDFALSRLHSQLQSKTSSPEALAGSAAQRLWEESPMPNQHTVGVPEDLSGDWLSRPGLTRNRFMSKISKDANGCWLWMAQLDRDGYAKVTIQTRKLFAHRAAYESRFGAIPAGLFLDHLCRTRNCVNPEHLELVTHRENVLRGERKNRWLPASTARRAA